MHIIPLEPAVLNVLQGGLQNPLAMAIGGSSQQHITSHELLISTFTRANCVRVVDICLIECKCHDGVCFSLAPEVCNYTCTVDQYVKDMSDLFTNLCTVSVYIQLYGLVDIHSKYGAHLCMN